MIRINLRNKRALGKNKNFFKTNNYKSASSATEQEGGSFQTLNNKVNELTNGTAKKLNKFINFKL